MEIFRLSTRSLIFLSCRVSYSHPPETPLGSLTHLGSELVVPLHKFVIVPGPMSNSIVHLEYACVAGLEDGHEALHHRAPESFAVHPFTKMKLFRGDLAT